VGNIVFVGEDNCRPRPDRQVGRIKGKVADSNPSRWDNLPSDFAREMGLGVEVDVSVPAQKRVYGVIKGVDALGWLRLKVRSGQGLSGSVVVQREDDGSCLPHCPDMDVGSRDILQPCRPDENGDLVLGVVELHDGGASGIGLDRVRGFLVARQLGCQRDGTNLPSDFASGMGLGVKVDIGVPAQKRIHDIIKSQVSTDRNLTFDEGFAPAIRVILLRVKEADGGRGRIQKPSDMDMGSRDILQPVGLPLHYDGGAVGTNADGCCA